MTRSTVVGGVLLAVILAACNPGVRDAEPFQGNWLSEPWGTYLAVNGGSVEVFEYSAAHCFSIASGSARGVADVLSIEGEDLVLTEAGRTVRFERVEFLRPDCIEPVADGPVAAFNVVVATFEEHYSPGLDVGWGARVEEFRPAVDASDDDLLGAVKSLLGPLARPDVRLSSGGVRWVADPVGPIEFVEGAESGMGGVRTGVLGDGISYLAFLRLGDLDESPQRSQRIAADAIDAAVASTRVVLDLRGSDGGSVDHAMLIASRIVPSERVVASLWARGPSGMVAAGDVAVRPIATGAFEGDMAVLVGPGTIGAAELLAAALSTVDGVTLIGRPTAGSAGPGMVRFLPNGWSIGLPNLSVTLPDGTDLAGGITPDLITEDALAAALEILAGH